MKVSLVVSTYNWPQALGLCLDSALAQTRLPDEIVIGDDGSGDETMTLIEKYQRVGSVRIMHIWQEDKGFRLAKIRNKAVMAASGDYIIQVDGDIIMHPRFIEDHLRLARNGYFLRGGRVMLGKTLTNSLCKGCIMPVFHFWTAGIISKRPNTLRSVWLSNFLASRYRPKNYVLGCNMSFYKSDFLRVNGYDENIEGWGGEDSDFFRRLKLSGVQNRRLKFAGLAYHLYHNQNSTYNSVNNARYSERINPDIYCKNGAIKNKEK